MGVGGRKGVKERAREREEKWEIFLAAANHFGNAVAREHSVRESALGKRGKGEL